ncbi:hypothetical protein PG990_005890 [Apiospora arundinis]|uniref:Uncharacterized protein n=1 Tax=Apiospora arundinis TaxID=335852 RepID=A0ABR2J9B0_9PEZI
MVQFRFQFQFEIESNSNSNSTSKSKFKFKSKSAGEPKKGSRKNNKDSILLMAAKVKERETLSVGLLCLERKARHDVHDITLTGTENEKGSE